MLTQLKFQDWDFAFINLPVYDIIISFFGQPLFPRAWQLK